MSTNGMVKFHVNSMLINMEWLIGKNDESGKISDGQQAGQQKPDIKHCSMMLTFSILESLKMMTGNRLHSAEPHAKSFLLILL